MRTAILAAALVFWPGLAMADCASDAKASLQARLSALPLREKMVSDRDGEHQTILLEMQTLQRFHTVIQSFGNAAAPSVELLILDGKGWSREHGRWKPFEAAAATAGSTAEDEQALADQLTEGATVTCLGPVTVDGGILTGFELKIDADPSSDAPYATMHLYVDPKTGLPQSLDMAGQGEAGPAITRQSFEYTKTLRLSPPK
jgi:hypothetical protein